MNVQSYNQLLHLQPVQQAARNEDDLLFLKKNSSRNPVRTLMDLRFCEDFLVRGRQRN